MSKKITYFCDICGLEFDDKSYRASVLFNANRDRHYDMCRRCDTDFMKWKMERNN